MIDPILTICIQTFNRSNYLECLLNGLPDCSSFRILVGDYSSEEYHSNLNKKICDQRTHIDYYRGQDLGLDHGFCELMQKAKSEYCWLMPDDDIILEKKLSHVLSILENKKPSLLLVNSSVYNESLTKALKHKSFTEKLLLKEVSSKNIADVEHVLSYIGSCIFNRRRWLEYKESKNIGTYFNHVYVAAELLNNGCELFALSLVCIKIRANNALWTAKSFQIWTENWPAALSSLKTNSTPAKNRIPTSTLLYYYAYGAINSERNPLIFRGSKILMLMDIFGQKVSSLIVYILISIKCFSLVSEPGYYVLKANKNKFSRFLLKVYYNE
ncbi:glycosyltransferase [Planktomarina temperata]|nr:glycosyltransferase [Planktomarina temperata]